MCERKQLFFDIGWIKGSNGLSEFEFNGRDRIKRTGRSVIVYVLFLSKFCPKTSKEAEFIVISAQFDASALKNYLIMSEKAVQLQQYNQDLVKCKCARSLRNFPWKPWTSEVFKTISFSDIDLLKKRKQKTELEIATDEKNKETVSNQIRLLTEKLEEIEHRQEKKRIALAKIDDTLTQSEIGMSWQAQNH